MKICLFLLSLFSFVEGSAVLISTPPRQLSLTSGNTVPQIAVSPTSNAIAVWATNFSNQIQASFYTRSTDTWSVPIVLASGSAPDVGIDQNGNGIAVWVLSNQILASFFSRSTLTWSVPVIISPTGFNISPRVSMSSSGNAIATWLNNFPPQVQVASFNIVSRTWDLPIQISFQGAAFPEISVDMNGNGIAVWQNLNTSVIESVFLLRR